MFELERTDIEGCFLIRPFVSYDERGSFVKLYHKDIFLERGLCTRFDEEFYSTSKKGVVRGMHFQLPPYDQHKLVCCITGKIHDVILDLRKGSPTFGRSASFELDASEPMALYMPPGIAHGFLAYTDEATMIYNIGAVYSREHDVGIHWASFGHRWPISDPIISERDATHPGFASFDSPF